MSILSFGELVDALGSNKVALITDHQWIYLRGLFHQGYLLQKTLVLIIILDLDLLHRIHLLIQVYRKHMGITPPDFLNHPYLFQAVISLDESVISKKLYHIILFGETLLLITYYYWLGWMGMDGVVGIMDVC